MKEYRVSILNDIKNMKIPHAIGIRSGVVLPSAVRSLRTPEEPGSDRPNKKQQKIILSTSILVLLFVTLLRYLCIPI